MLSKIIGLESTDIWRNEQRAMGRRVGFTCGAFDLLHAGHVDFLERAKALCDQLLVAVNSDNSIRSYKNPLRPANPEAQRMQVVAGLGCVDTVVLMEEERPIKLIERWRPDLYIKGGDYSSTGLRSGSAVERYGGKVVLLPFSTEQSTTAIMARIASIQAHASLKADSRQRSIQGIVFLDRDGTLIRNVPYLHDPAKVEILPGVAQGLRRLQDAGFRLVIVTNQQGIGLGYFPLEAFFEVNHALFRLLGLESVRIDKVYFCPHSFADDCRCRKPGPALLEKALEDFGTGPENCWMLGDNQSDIAAGQSVGCRSLLIGSDVAVSGMAGYSFTDAVAHILTSMTAQPRHS